MLIDTHCHLDRLDINPEVAIAAAKNNDVAYILSVCVELETFPRILAIAEQHDNVFASLGLHPTEVVNHEPNEQDLINLASHPKVIAIGETGLDYYHQDTTPELQHRRLREHIRAARYLNKPLIIHTRQAQEDTMRILTEEKAHECGGIMHCFTESWAMAQQALELGFYISFSGIVTFKNAIDLKELAKKVPLDRMLIETDAPYLAPMPYRGKPNQPAYVRFVAEHIAELRGIRYAELAEQTTKNFFRLFNIPLS